jgi:2-oxoisovalerate dehydrogenase E1 component
LHKEENMYVFSDIEQLYEVLDATFRRARQDPEVAQELRAGNLVVRFRYHDPTGEITIDLTQDPITWTCGQSDLPADVTMTQSGDTSHRFWLGQLSVPRAIATGQIVARGSVPKALALLPAVKPIFGIYEQTLRELGYARLIPEEVPKRRLRKKWPWPGLLKRAKRVMVDYQALGRHLIPLTDGEAPQPELRFFEQDLPTDKAALKVEMLRRMHLIRAFEEKLAEANTQGQIPTEAIHLSIGQEATAVGACFALRGSDYMATTHRGHGHMLAKGASLRGMMAELLGKADGLCGGKGGSMHVTQATVGALGANGIVGAPGLLAIGAALSARHRGSRQVAVAFMGDGATNQGMFHEALNLAAVLDLPVVFVIENNLYGEFTPLERHTRVTRLADRAAAYGIPGRQVDGNDVWAVYEEMGKAVEGARKGHGPTLLECATYRWHGHMEGETAHYRDETEIAAWRARCPITRLEQELCVSGILAAAETATLAQEAKRLVDDAFAAALDSPEPPLSALTDHVYAPEPAHLYGAPHPSRPSSPPVRTLTCAAALWEALAEEMARDRDVFLLGEDVTMGGYFAVTAGLVDEFGPGRVIDTPISEYAIVGAAVGSAMAGMRPVAEILFSDFLTCCMDPIVNQAAKLRYMSGGQVRLPLVIRTPGGAGLGMAAQHSQSWEALLTGIPGLIVIAPGTPGDAKGLLKTAIRSNNPVLFFENKLLYLTTGPVPEGDFLVPLGLADVKRTGQDITLVSVGAALSLALEAASALAGDGINVEVVDLRTLVPCDWATVARSVVKTGRLAVVEEGVLTHGFGAEVVARLAGAAWGALKAPPVRIAALDVPIPYNRSLENAAVPDVERVVAALKRLHG